jgi:flagellar basal-body rod protein FlgB
MLNSLFQSTTIPAMEQVVNFSEARHNVLAGNIANMDTPGYKARDLSVEGFQSRLKQAIESQRDGTSSVSPGDPNYSPGTNIAEVSKDSRNILYHDEHNVGMEFQVTEMVKNQLQHNTALTIMNSQFRLLQAVISERA